MKIWNKPCVCLGGGGGEGGGGVDGSCLDYNM